MSKVYVKLDENDVIKVITEINSDVFLDTVQGYTLIDEGEGDKYAHSQGNYLELGLIDNQGRYNYKLQEGNVIALTEDEKTALFPIQPIAKTIDEEQDEMLAELAYQVSLMELGGI